jgi:hypothetical protein
MYGYFFSKSLDKIIILDYGYYFDFISITVYAKILKRIWCEFLLMANFENIKKSLEQNGEVMIRLDNNEKIELHRHNVKFDDNSKEIIIDAASETFWIGADKVSYYWIHREGFSKE